MLTKPRWLLHLEGACILALAVVVYHAGHFRWWMFAALLTSFFPLAVAAFAPAAVFAFFALMMLLQLIWVQTLVVETKGVSLEQISERLSVPKDLQVQSRRSLWFLVALASLALVFASNNAHAEKDYEVWRVSN